jgi:uncharacterized protein (TIGR03067 family)
MATRLPARPNLDHLRKQAKTLLAALAAGDTAAANTFIAHLPAARKLTPAAVRAAGFRLADAQSAVARQTGFASWPALARHVEQLRALEGEWHFTTLEVDGVAMPDGAFIASRLLIDGDRFRMESAEASYDGIFTIDVEATPARIDVEFVEGPEAGGHSYGIYALDGHTLKMCIGLVGSDRPARFGTSKGSGHALETLTRASAGRQSKATGGKRAPAAGAESGAAAARAIDPSTDPAIDPSFDPAAFGQTMNDTLRRLEGEWTPLELVQNGEVMRNDWLAFGRRVGAGVETKVVFGGQTMVHARVRIDENRTPMPIDYLHLSGRSKGQIALGLFEWDGDTARFIMSAPGKPRPGDFSCASGSHRTLSRWRRTGGDTMSARAGT